MAKPIGRIAQKLAEFQRKLDELAEEVSDEEQAEYDKLTRMMNERGRYSRKAMMTRTPGGNASVAWVTPTAAKRRMLKARA